MSGYILPLNEIFMYFILESGSFHCYACYVPKYLLAKNVISILANPSDLLNVRKYCQTSDESTSLTVVW